MNIENLREIHINKGTETDSNTCMQDQNMNDHPELENICLDTGFCSYGAGVMIPLLHDLNHELEGVQSGDDIEYVHRSRVATRRLRAAIPIFAPCLPDKQRKRWNREIKEITRSLGRARDLDVQIAFIREYLLRRRGTSPALPGLFSSAGETPTGTGNDTAVIISHHEEETRLRQAILSRIRRFIPRRKKPEPAVDAGHEPDTVLALPPDPARPGLECLLLRLVQERRDIQPDLVEITGRTLESGIIGDMTTCLHGIRVRGILESGERTGIYLYQQAFIQIMIRTEEFLWHESSLADESRIHDHHAMRIAAKRLRYTLEIFSGLFGDELKREIRTMKKLQDLLGEIHDCDVWTGMLPGFLKEEEERACAYFGNPHLMDLIRPGVMDLVNNRDAERSRLFAELVRTWGEVKAEKFWENLNEKISAPVRTGFRGPAGSPGDEANIIALISDIHANLPALEAVLADAKTRGAVAVLNAGDIIGYGAFPDETIDLIRSSPVMSVIGNYDLAVLKKRWKTKKFRNKKKHLAMRWAYHNMTPGNREWLSGLPDRIRLTVKGKRLLITHGSPESITEYLTGETPVSRLEKIAQTVNTDFIITGHSHAPAVREAGGTWFINCGSVGRPEDGDFRACYALLTLDPLTIVHIRVPYDLERAVNGMKKKHLPEAFIRTISEGRPLDAVSGREGKA